MKLAIDLPKHTAGALGVGGRAALFRPHRLGHVDTGLWFMRRVLRVLEDVPPQRGLAVHEKAKNELSRCQATVRRMSFSLLPKTMLHISTTI